MHRATYVISLNNMVDDFLPPQKSEHYLASKAIRNVFVDVPTFRSEHDMYEYVTEMLNNSTVYPFVATFCRLDRNCGMYASVRAPHEDYPEALKEQRSSAWSLLGLLVKCQLDPVLGDPFYEGDGDNKPVTAERKKAMGQILSCAELAFKYQQRQFVFMVLFLGHYARVVRFDRSGVVASEKFDYTQRGDELTTFFVRYCRLGSKDRGHDPRASHISPTHPLWQQLKKHGADAAKRDSKDHVQKVFNGSLDDKWPWWRLSVADEESGLERCFAVGKPHYYAGGVVGRGTRGYVAVPLNDGGEPEGDFVYLKDAWRLGRAGLQKEGSVLKTLNAARVPYVPTLLYHGDLNQVTQSYDHWSKYHPGKTRDNCPLESHQHYRLVMAEVGKPLSEFEHGFQLVWALFCCISAHEEACAAGYIHRDISAGNILLYKDENDEWAGLLNDWEMSGKFVAGATEHSGQQLGRVGTWQFMSVGTLLSKAKFHTIADDLESFFHVLIYYAVRFLPHNLTDAAVARFLYSYFDDYTDGVSGDTCGQLKYYAMRRGVIDVALISRGIRNAAGMQTVFLEFHMPPSSTPSNDETSTDGITYWSHPLSPLIDELLKAFQALYEQGDTDVEEEGAIGQRTQAKKSRRRGASTSESAAAAKNRAMIRAQLADKVKTHDSILELIITHLGDFAWPAGDKGKDRKPGERCVVAQENRDSGSIVKVGSKRPHEDSGSEGLAAKRIRNSA